MRLSRLRLLLCALLFLATLSACYLLSRVYPFMLAQPDSFDYLRQALYLHWGVLLKEDVNRPPLFSMLLRIALLFRDPGFSTYWIHAFLFAMSIVVAYIVAAKVLASELMGFLTALALLGLEIMSMRIFFYNLELLSEPLYSYLLFIGTLLVAYGISQKHVQSRYIGFLLLGLAPLVRPIGIALFLFWLPYLGWQLFQAIRHHVRASTVSISICAALFLTPSAIWYVRMSIVTGGFFTPQMLGLHLMAKSNALVTTGALLSADPIANERMHAVLAEGIHKHENALLDLMKEEMTQQGTTYTSWRTPAGSRFGLQFASNVFFHNPIGYLSIVFEDYWTLLTPTFFMSNDYISYHQNPSDQYDEIFHKNFSADQLAIIYPHGSGSVVTSDEHTAQLLQNVCCNNPVGLFLRGAFGTMQTIIMQVIEIAAVLCVFIISKLKQLSPNMRAITQQTSIIIALTMGIALFHTLMTAFVVFEAEPRFTVPTIELMHFAVLLLIALLLRLCVLLLRRTQKHEHKS